MKAAWPAAAQRPRARPHALRAPRWGGRAPLLCYRGGSCSRPGCPRPHLTRSCRPPPPAPPPPRARSNRPAVEGKKPRSGDWAEPGVLWRPLLLRTSPVGPAPRPAQRGTLGSARSLRPSSRPRWSRGAGAARRLLSYPEAKLTCSPLETFILGKIDAQFTEMSPVLALCPPNDPSRWALHLAVGA